MYLDSLTGVGRTALSYIDLRLVCGICRRAANTASFGLYWAHWSTAMFTLSAISFILCSATAMKLLIRPDINLIVNELWFAKPLCNAGRNLAHLGSNDSMLALRFLSSINKPSTASCRSRSAGKLGASRTICDDKTSRPDTSWLTAYS